jgi:hypothetical protein
MHMQRLQNVPRPGRSEDATVTRRVDVNWDRATSSVTEVPRDGAIPLAGGGTLCLDTPFQPVRDLTRARAACGRLVGSGPRLASCYRVCVVVSEWSTRAVVVRVMPRSPRLYRWGGRRLARYFRLAHDAANALIEHRHASPVTSTPR